MAFETRGNPDLLSAEERLYWVLLTMVPGIGPVRFQRLLDVCGSAREAWSATDAAFQAAGIDKRTLAQLKELRRSIKPQGVLAHLERLGITVLTSQDMGYPAALLQINDPPPVLYVRGGLLPSVERCVAFVGTRRSTPYGRTVAEQFAGAAAASGAVIVSGLAKGIDTVAHRAALAVGGSTLAVLGSGLDQIYPPENSSLARQIAEAPGSALISEFGLGTRPDAINFPRRNRIIAGLSTATVIVEAGMKSGALITADFALEQGRDVLAVPGSVLSPMSSGPNGLIRQGATPITCEADLLEALGLDSRRQNRGEAPPPADLSQAERGALLALGREPIHVDDLARTLQWPASDVTGTLTLLELKGLARQVGAMAYIRC